jgi:2,5-diketo-D-gluconate reductase B
MQLITKSGKSLHPIGIGTWGISSEKTQEDNKYVGVVPSKGNEDTEIEALRYSLDQGQNHLDCAELYGGFYTDEVVGRAISNYTRKDLFIADKLWKPSVEKGQVRTTVELMLKKLGTDYLDMLYIHYPWSDAPWHEAIPQIDQLIDEGIIRHFAVSNFTVDDMKKVAKLSKHPIAANQMNYNVLHKTEVDEEFIAYCLENDITIIAYQPIKRGEVFGDPTIKTIANKYDVTASQVSLAWLLQNDAIPIPKAISKPHIDDNLAAMDLMLNNEDIAALNIL